MEVVGVVLEAVLLHLWQLHMMEKAVEKVAEAGVMAVEVRVVKVQAQDLGLAQRVMRTKKTVRILEQEVRPKRKKMMVIRGKNHLNQKSLT